jgi:glycogen operon protein
MILMGDEVRRTQSGNNNNYCHDDKANWFDWNLLEKHADIHRFVKLLIQRRLRRDVEAERQRKSLDQLIREAHKAWHGVKLLQPDWNDWSHSLAFSAEIKNENLLVHFIMNAYWEFLEFELPRVGDHGETVWHRWIDTALEAPLDIVEWQAAPEVLRSVYRAEPRSVVVLFANIDHR